MSLINLHELPEAWRADPKANAEGCARQLEELLRNPNEPDHAVMAILELACLETIKLRRQLAEISPADEITKQVLIEVKRACAKFPTWPTDPLHALAVLGEEFGELTKEMLQLTYEPHKTAPAKVRAEAVQTAAMALRLLRSLDRYEYQPGPEHSQTA